MVFKIKRKNLSFNIFNFRMNMPILFIATYLLVDFLRFFNMVPVLIGNILYLILGFLVIAYSVIKKGIARQIPIFKFIFIYIFFGAIGVLFNGNIDFQELLWPFGFMGIGILLLNFDLDLDYKIMKHLYYFSLFFIVMQIIMSSGVDHLEAAASRNTVGIMALIYFSLHAISNHANKKKLSIVPVLFGLLTTILAVGRSGILTFVILALLFLVFEFNGNTQKIRNPLKWIIIIAIGGLIFWISYNYLNTYFTETIRNFQNRGVESIRIEIWKDYLHKTSTSIKYIFFGTPIEGTFLLDVYSNNLHNSFLMLHAKYGIIILLLVVSHFIRTFVFFLKEKDYLYLSLLLSVLFRMQFDYTNFNAQLDIILIYLLFFRYFYKYKKTYVHNKFKL